MSAWNLQTIREPGTPLFALLILINVSVTTFMSVMSATITIIADLVIRGELALSAPQSSWVTTFYLLGLNSMVPASSWLGERFGYRRVYALGVFLFTLGSGFAGLSPNFPVLGFCRLLEGVAAGIIFPIGLAMIVRNTEKSKLVLALNLYIAVAFGGGLGLGILFSGYVSQFMSWRDLFLAFLPFGALATIDCWLFHEKTPPQNSRPFDVWGYLSFITFIASLVVALSFGALPSTNEGWTDPLILSCFALSFVSLIATIFIESRHPAPIIPLPLFRNSVFLLCITAMLLIGIAFFSSVSSSVDFMIKALLYERHIVGLVASVYGLSIGLTSILATQLSKKVHPTILALLGLTLLAISFFLNNIITLQSYPLQVIWILLLRGVGVGICMGPITALALSAVPRALAGSASTLLTFFRQAGGTFGGIIVTILVIKRKIFHVARFSEPVSDQIPGYGYTFQKLSTKFSSFVCQNSFLSDSQAKLEIVRTIETQAFVQSLNDAMMVFGYITITILLLFLLLLFLKRRQIFQSEQK